MAYNLLGFKLDIEYDGITRTLWQGRVNRFNRRVRQGFKEPLSRHGDYMLKKIDDGFDRRGSPKKWRQLNPRYAKWKAKAAPGKGILEFTSQMRRSFKMRVTRNLLRIENNRAVRGWQLYEIHQYGLEVPRRRMLQMTSKDQDHLIAEMRGYLFDD